MLNGVITVIFSVIGLLGNIFTIWAIMLAINTTERSDTSTNILLVNLCVFDLLVCSVVFPHEAWLYFYNGLPFSIKYCKLFGAGKMFLSYGERFALAGIAVNATNLLRVFPFTNRIR